METFAVKFYGGALDGLSTAVQGEWPLPEHMRVQVDGEQHMLYVALCEGDPEYCPHDCYSKVSESQLDTQPENSPVVRGAMYQWLG